ncbi:MAG: Holliday junction branch migration protein RuvA [Synergistaceae bacterium]|jgi:Holliday junction DNA helicase RuvA|nr:Holliday junction branch migration protein RuvA [Synergistaceae bacterium]
MIHSLRGAVLSVGDETICLDVAGFGLEVYASGSLLARAVAGEELSCLAWLQVSDAGMSMFGFSDESERALFLDITQVKTMGGKLSITLLRHLGAGAIVSAIMASDATRLAVPGLGPKRAERICFELRPKIEKKFAHLASGEAAIRPSGSVDGEVISGLVGLGFSQGEAARAVSLCRSEGGDREWSEEDLLMSSLARLRRR